MTGTAFVSGGSGYIANFIIRDLLATGWTVHTTLRSLSREAELRALLAAQEVDVSALRCFAADLLADAGWAQALAGCTHALVQHPEGLRGLRERRVHDVDEGREDGGPSAGLTPRAVASGP